MRKLFVLFVVLALTACAAPAAAPTQAVVAQPEQPTQTPVVVVQTVVVESTQVPATEAPAQPAVITVVVEPTQVPPTQAPAAQPAATDANAAGAPIALDNMLGAGVFVNMTMSGDSFTFRCYPRDITFNVTANDPAIKKVIFYYRMVDKPDALYPSEWKIGGEMNNNGGGNFSLVFSGDNVDPNVRLDDAWMDFQFVGLNKGNGVVDRTQKIERRVNFMKECPK